MDQNINFEMDSTDTVATVSTEALNPFDYLNADWIKDDGLRAKVQGKTAENVKLVVAVFEHPAYAKFAQPLDINQFTASYEGIYGPGSAPTQTTLRAHLKTAIKMGKLAKYSRQSYGLPGVTEGQPMKDTDEAADTGSEA